MLSGVIVSCGASLTQFCVSSVCLLCFFMSQWVIGVLVIAVPSLRWHMPPSWLPAWQDRCCGESKRMLEQITLLPLPSSEWHSLCHSFSLHLFHALQALNLPVWNVWSDPPLYRQETTNNRLVNGFKIGLWVKKLKVMGALLCVGFFCCCFLFFKNHARANSRPTINESILLLIAFRHYLFHI